MITNKGKEIIGKYLLGQVPAYATHIALGCGATPAFTEGTAPIISPTKSIMDFEMIRVPISSKGFITESDGTTKIVLATQMPIEERYEISEVALWSAGSNSLTKSDSRILFAFNSTENWQVHKETTPQVVSALPERFDRLNSDTTSNDIEVTYDGVNPIKIFSTYSDNEVLLSSIRKDRYEGARFLNYTIMMRGDSSILNSSFEASANAQHIHLEASTVNLSQNSPNDIIKFGLSIIGAQETEPIVSPNTVKSPYSTRIKIEFLESENNTSTGYAYLKHTISQSELEQTRYQVITKKLSELEYGPEFSWSKVSVVKIYVSIFLTSTTESSLTPTENFYVSLDALRFENVTTENPLHIMSGYSIVETYDGRPIYKIANTSNYIEFRFPISAGV